MALLLGELKGITDAVLNVLKAQGLGDSEALLEAARTPTGRKQLATASGVDASMILDLANRADLARVKGIGSVYGDLLEEAGVDTVKELARRSPENLHEKISQVAADQQLTQRVPTLDQVRDFIEQAKSLPGILEY